MGSSEHPEDQIEQALAARLRRLSTLPIDTTKLDRRLRSSIAPPRPVFMRLLRPLTAVAASLTILVLITAAFLTTSSSEVLASPAMMAQVHQDILANRIPVTKVNSIDEAGQVLASQWAGGPNLPQAPQTHVMACCMKSIKNKKVACVLLESEGTPITMSIATALSITCSPPTPST